MEGGPFFCSHPVLLEIDDDKVTERWHFKCKMCQLLRDSQNSIETHLDLIHNRKLWTSKDVYFDKTAWILQCKICNFQSSKETEMEKHVNRHLKNSEREEETKSKETLKTIYDQISKNCHFDDMNYEEKIFKKCPCCNQGFKTNALMIRHIKRSHKNMRELYEKLVENHMKSGKDHQYLDEIFKEKYSKLERKLFMEKLKSYTDKVEDVSEKGEDKIFDKNHSKKPVVPPDKIYEGEKLWNFKCHMCLFQHQSQMVMETHASKVV